MKRLNPNAFRAFLLLFFFLQSKVGVAFNIHYCGGHVAQISSAFHPKNCGMETPEGREESPTPIFSQKPCCADELVIAQNDDAQHITAFEDLEVQLDFALPLYTPALAPARRPERGKCLLRPPPKSEKKYLHYCALMVYEEKIG